MKMSRGKRNVLFAGVLSCAMLFGIGNTMAYFTENSVQTNVFTTGDLDIGLKEPDWDPNENDGKNMYPGYTVYKNPTVKNITSDKNGDEPCYVRMSVDILNSQGTPITDDQALNLIYKTIYFDKTFTGGYDKKEGKATGLIQDQDSWLQPCTAGSLSNGKSIVDKGHGTLHCFKTCFQLYGSKRGWNFKYWRGVYPVYQYCDSYRLEPDTDAESWKLSAESNSTGNSEQRICYPVRSLPHVG